MIDTPNFNAMTREEAEDVFEAMKELGKLSKPDDEIDNALVVVQTLAWFRACGKRVTIEDMRPAE